MYSKKYKTVGEVARITGLTPKLINDYESVIPPIDHKGHVYYKNDRKVEAYKLYDDDAVEKFSFVSLMRHLGMPRSYIKSKISEYKNDNNQILNDVIEKAEYNLQKAKDILTFTEWFKNFGLSGLYGGMFDFDDLHSTAERIRRLYNSDLYKKLSKKLSSLGDKALFQILNDIANNKTEAIKHLIDLFDNHYGMVFTIAIVLSYDNSLSNDINNVIKGSAGAVSDNIMSYIYDNYFEPIYDTFDDIESDNLPFDDDKVKVALNELISFTKELFQTLAEEYLPRCLLLTVEMFSPMDDFEISFINAGNDNEAIDLIMENNRMNDKLWKQIYEDCYNERDSKKLTLWQEVIQQPEKYIRETIHHYYNLKEEN